MRLGVLKAAASAALLAGALAAGVARAQGSHVDLGPDPYVPTPTTVVARMLELAGIAPGDLVVDLGSGDGRLVIAAARDYGARGVGFEIDRSLVSEAEAAARAAGVAARVRFEARDLFQADLSEVAVLTLYLLPATNLRLRPKILAEMRPGARVVSHQFDLGDWLPDHAERVLAVEDWAGIDRDRLVYLWIVPAKVAGRWTLLREPSPGTALALDLDQRYQHVAARGDPALAPRFAPLRGVEVRFTLPAASPFAGEYQGTAARDAMHGTFVAADGTRGTWRALREGAAAAVNP
ncbi:MAG: methyltransferase domain-containing protein [Burkholderiales bacterium]|nr:methyltransferase domain-containing protein [Burkholderiales bacterium]